MHSSLVCIDSSYSGCFTICISYDNTLYSLGFSPNNAHGHKEKTIFPIKQIQNLNNIKMVSCGYEHTIVIDFDGNCFSFGYNEEGQLGIGSNIDKTYIPQKLDIPPCKQVSCGGYFSICLTEDNILYSFGFNNIGQLGLGLNCRDNSSKPQQIPDLNDIEYIVCGIFHAICKTYNNEHYSWGGNFYGQLGQGNNNNCNKPIQCLNWPDNIISIKCGLNHSLLLSGEGLFYSFGDNSYGQLGINDKTIESINKPILIKDIPEIQRIECGYEHIMCIDINNNLWVFGQNIDSQLGLGDFKDKYNPILHPTLSNIIDISSGGEHTFVKTIDNKIYAFGKNYHSQLGIKTSAKRLLTPIQVFKDKEDIWHSFIGKSRAKSARK